jgi:hypothetical protein
MHEFKGDLSKAKDFITKSDNVIAAYVETKNTDERAKLDLIIEDLLKQYC